MINQPSGVSIGCGDKPILFASHQAPRLASKTTVWSPQCLRSGENEIQMFALFAGKLANGRWTRAQRPPNRRGNKAASLSSGGITAPFLSKERKSFVRASDTSGPLDENEA